MGFGRHADRSFAESHMKTLALKPHSLRGSIPLGLTSSQADIYGFPKSSIRRIPLLDPFETPLLCAVPPPMPARGHSESQVRSHRKSPAKPIACVRRVLPRAFSCGWLSPAINRLGAGFLEAIERAKLKLPRFPLPYCL